MCQFILNESCKRLWIQGGCLPEMNQGSLSRSCDTRLLQASQLDLEDSGLHQESRSYLVALSEWPGGVPLKSNFADTGRRPRTWFLPFMRFLSLDSRCLDGEYPKDYHLRSHMLRGCLILLGVAVGLLPPMRKMVDNCPRSVLQSPIFQLRSLLTIYQMRSSVGKFRHSRKRYGV